MLSPRGILPLSLFVIASHSHLVILSEAKNPGLARGLRPEVLRRPDSAGLPRMSLRVLSVLSSRVPTQSGRGNLTPLSEIASAEPVSLAMTSETCRSDLLRFLSF